MNEPRPCLCDRCGVGSPYVQGECRQCWLYHNDQRYRVMWGGPSEGVDLERKAEGVSFLELEGDRGMPPTPVDIGKGPGAELRKMLEAFGIRAAGCGCKSRAAQMDRWGPARCRERREEIVAWLKAEADKRGWLARMAANVTAGWLVDEAIRRAEVKEQEKQH